MSARVIPILRQPHPTPRARLERAIALSVELRALLAPGFPIGAELLAGTTDRLAGEEVRMRSTLAAMTGHAGDAA